MIYLKALAELGGDPRLGRWLCLYKAKTSVALFFFLVVLQILFIVQNEKRRPFGYQIQENL